MKTEKKDGKARTGEGIPAVLAALYHTRRRRLSIIAILGTTIVVCLFAMYYDTIHETSPFHVAEERTSDTLLERTTRTIASKFICSCGRCGRKPLDVCTCKTAVGERRVIRAALRSGKAPTEIVQLVDEMFGWKK